MTFLKVMFDFDVCIVFNFRINSIGVNVNLEYAQNLFEIIAWNVKFITL